MGQTLRQNILIFFCFIFSKNNLMRKLPPGTFSFFYLHPHTSIYGDAYTTVDIHLFHVQATTDLYTGMRRTEPSSTTVLYCVYDADVILFCFSIHSVCLFLVCIVIIICILNTNCTNFTLFSTIMPFYSTSLLNAYVKL